MKTAITRIAINEPCTQNWADMEQRAGERFCNTCQKCVIDFSSYSGAEIMQTLANSTGEVCGRLTQTQLDQLNYQLVWAPTQKTWIKYLGVLAIGVSIFAQTANATVPKDVPAIMANLHAKDGDPKPIKINRIYGYVLDGDKKPLAGIKVVISNTKFFGITDKDGKYEIKLGESFNAKNNLLKIESSSYQSELTLNYAKEKQSDMVLLMEPIMMGKIMMKN